MAEEWYFNVADGSVAEGKQPNWADRMGPYATEAQARDALKTAQLRNERADQWDEED